MGVMYSTEESSTPSTPASGKVALYFKTDGYWYYLDDAGTEFRLVPGSAGTLAQKHIAGLTYSNNSTDPTNDIDIAAGSAKDGTNAYDLVLASTLVKQLDAAWAVGTNAGGLDTGSIGNSDYYIWLIARSDTGVIDALFSLSASAPTMPTNYDYKRLIGWFKRSGGAIVAFTTYEIEGGGLEYLWTTPTLDIDLSNTLTTSRRTDAVRVPLLFSVLAHMNVMIYDAGGNQSAYIYAPDAADLGPAINAAPLTSASAISTTNTQGTRTLWIRTSSTGTIAARADVATMDNYRVSTLGFRWGRRN